MRERLVIALDGHDGAGKTTLASILANRIGGKSVRPFSGAIGAELMRAGECKDIAQLIRIGNSAIAKAVASVSGNTPVILDRGWMTVASFIPESEEFYKQWNNWVPTALCWAELRTTLSRLSIRSDEKLEPLEWHEHYIAVYLEIAKRSESLIVRTDLMDHETCTNKLVTWVTEYSVKPYCC